MALLGAPEGHNCVCTYQVNRDAMANGPAHTFHVRLFSLGLCIVPCMTFKVPGPQKYVELWPFGQFFWGLGPLFYILFGFR